MYLDLLSTVSDSQFHRSDRIYYPDSRQPTIGFQRIHWLQNKLHDWQGVKRKPYPAGQPVYMKWQWCPGKFNFLSLKCFQRTTLLSGIPRPRSIIRLSRNKMNGNWCSRHRLRCHRLKKHLKSVKCEALSARSLTMSDGGNKTFIFRFTAYSARHGLHPISE